MRVVAGTARGRNLVAPPGRATRPTGDKVRQAMFNALESLGRIDGATLLDLFAGTGALGVEGLSRGAAHCTFVEPDRTARRCIAENLLLVPGTDQRVVASTADQFLAQPHAAPERFDVALVDPPYSFDAWAELMARLPTGFVVIESDREVDPGPGWEIVRSRRYGGTVVAFAQRVATHSE